MNIKKSIAYFQKLTQQAHCKLIAVSKTKTVAEIYEAYEAGQRRFGENKVQEITEKYDKLPKDIEWHMIGHLQSNKVKYIAPFIALIHSVDSIKLAKEINKQAEKNNRKIPILLQVHIAKEETKFGFDENELKQLIEKRSFDDLSAIQVFGLMGMATLTDNPELIHEEFANLCNLYTRLNNTGYFGDDFKELSMGMTSDYQIALDEGSTMVRIGSAIFGERN